MVQTDQRIIGRAQSYSLFVACSFGADA